MNLEDHPGHPGWKQSEELQDIRDLPTSPEEGMRCFYGAARGDWDHRLFLVPINTRIDEIVDFFEVGTHNALAHGWEERETMDLINQTLTEVDEIVPGSIELATVSSLHFRFWRQLRLDELEEIETVYQKVDEYQAGLEDYINGLTGGSILAEVRETGVLKLRWV
jgi:hypothetical protein